MGQVSQQEGGGLSRRGRGGRGPQVAARLSQVGEPCELPDFAREVPSERVLECISAV